MSQFHLRLCQPLDPDHPSVLQPITYVDVNPDITALEWTTVNPGGFGALNVGMQPFLTDSGAGPDYVRLETPVALPPRAHVELYAGSTLLFEGAVMTVAKNSSGRADGFIAEGYGLVATNDDFLESTETTPKTSGTILAEALTDAAPLLRIGPIWVDPGVYHVKSEFHALFPSDIINQIIREGGPLYSGIVSNAGGASGDVSNGVWDFLVYENREVIFRPRIPPAGTLDDPIAYHIAFDDRIGSWVEDYHKLVSQASVRYTSLNTAGGATKLTPRTPARGSALYELFKSRYGFTRAAVIDGGKMRDQSANVFGVTYIANRSQPSYAVRIMRIQQQGMERVGMADMPPYLVRAGEWVAVGDQDALPIVQTSYDAFSEVGTFDCGDALPHGLVDNRTLHRIANHIVRGTNPVTGARA